MRKTSKRFLPLEVAFLLFLTSFVLEKGFQVHAAFWLIMPTFLVISALTITYTLLVPVVMFLRKKQFVRAFVGSLFGSGALAVMAGGVMEFKAPTKLYATGQWLVGIGIALLVTETITTSLALLRGVLARGRN